MQHFCKQPPQTPLFISFLEFLEDPGGVTEKAKKAEKSDAVKKKKQKMQDYKKSLPASREGNHGRTTPNSWTL